MKKKHTLILYLQSLEKKELNKFRRFLTITKFQTNTKKDKGKRLIKLFQLIEQYVLKKSTYNTAVQTTIYNKLYAGLEKAVKVINRDQKTKLAADMRELTTIVEQFLMYEALEEDKVCQIRLLGKKLVDKNQEDLWDHFKRQTENKLKEKKVPKLSIIEANLQLEMLKLEFIERQGQLKEKDNLEVLIRLIDQYWLLNKFELHSMMQSLLNAYPQKDYSQVVSLDTYFDLKKIYEKSSTTSSEFKQRLLLNNAALVLDRHPSMENYNSFLKYLEENKSSLTKNEAIGFWHQANNFCVSKIRQGESIFRAKLLASYKTMDNWGVLTKQDYVQFSTLLNIVKLSCENKDFIWAKEVIDKYSPFITINERETAKNLLYCAVYFYKGNDNKDKTDQEKNYQKAKKYISDVDEQSALFRLMYKVLKVKLMYEVDKKYNPFTFPNFENMIAAIRRTKNLKKESIIFNVNFITILKHLYLYKHGLSNLTLEDIKNKVETVKEKSGGISSEQWLMEKIGELAS